MYKMLLLVPAISILMLTSLSESTDAQIQTTTVLCQGSGMHQDKITAHQIAASNYLTNGLRALETKVFDLRMAGHTVLSITWQRELRFVESWSPGRGWSVTYYRTAIIKYQVNPPGVPGGPGQPPSR